MHREERFEWRFRRRVRPGVGVGKAADRPENMEMRIASLSWRGYQGLFGIRYRRKASFVHDLFFRMEWRWLQQSAMKPVRYNSNPEIDYQEEKIP
jgi:hypothetical protein